MKGLKLAQPNHRLWSVRLGLTMGLALLFLAALLWRLQDVTPARADPGTLYVDGVIGSDDSDCSNPADPCATIGYALTQAGNGDEILVAAGTYTETLDVGGNPLTLRGGYTVNGTVWLPQGGETVVDADGADSPVFTFHPGNSVTVEGFTIQGANHTFGEGGGFWINASTVVISGTVIRDNSTDGPGSGVWIENSVGAENVKVSLINSTIVNNSAGDDTAGLMVSGGDPIQVTIENTVFTGNTGSDVLALDNQPFEMVGGQVSSNTVTGDSAINIGGSGSGIISGTEIMSNSSSAMGIWSSDNVVSAHNLTIRGNTGGGIVNRGVLTLTHSLVENNSGGGWFLIASVNEDAPGTERVMLDGCTIRGNTDIPGVVGLGGYAQVQDTVIVGNDNVAVNGDVINIWPDATQVNLVNVLLADNKSARPVVNGNAVTGTISLMNVTVAGNSVSNFPILAGEGIWTVTNTIVWGNTAPGDMLGLGTFSVSYSDIGGGWPGPGNIDADPRFTDPANGDYHLLPWSPCIDKGAATDAPDHDLDGVPRPQNTGYDMGAYEFVGTPIANQGTRYVAMEGTDAAPNLCLDNALPCQTINRALDMANPGETILVAQGIYTENLTLSKPITLTGGYEAAGWTRDLTRYKTIIDGSSSQTVWGDWDGNHIYAPAVIADAGVYKMWYTGMDAFGTERIGYAESADGVNWTRLITNPVLDMGTPGDWDEWGVGQPSVIKQGGLYQMWFFGGNDDGIKQIGYATSTNGIDWTKYAGSPVLTVGDEGDWDETEVGGPRVLFDGATYHLWYHGYSGSCCDSIGYATSPDGINWTKHLGNPVFGPSDPGEWDDSLVYATAVLSDSGQLHMWYSTSWVDNAGIGYVTSTNGISWTRFLTGPVLPVGGPGEWDENYVSWPAVIRDGGAYRMWYRGHDTGWWAQFGYATSPDGIVWTKSVGNPVLSPGTPTQWGEPVLRFEAGSDGTVLDGFTITGGDAEAGGGVLIANSGSAVIANSVITGNHALNWAGGVWVTNADATIRNSSIAGNRTTNFGGAGIEVNSDYGPAHLTLESSTFSHNVGTQHGGGLHVWDASVEVRDVTFIGNTTGVSGGGIAVDQGSSAVINGSHVINNTAGHFGGGIAIWAGSSATIAGTQIYANTAEGGEGGGLASEDGNVSLASSWVVANAALNNEGGGISIGAGSSAYVENSVIAGNTSGTNGGGFWFTDGGPYRIVNSDIIGNETADEGAAIAAAYTVQVEVTNTLIISNTGNTGIADRDGSGSVFLLSYCDTYGNSPDGTNGVTIIRTNCLGTPPADGLDPLLAGGALPGGVGLAFAAEWMSYDYHLQLGSPCIDAGTLVGAPSTDFEYDLRPIGAGFDMGADETPLVVTVDPAVSATLVYTDPQGSPTTLEVPAGAVAAPTTIVYAPKAPQVVSAIPPGLALGGHAFDLDAYQDGNLIPGFTFEKAVTLTIEYSDADVAGLVEGTLALYRWTGSEWEEIGTRPGESYTLDTKNNVLMARLRGLSKFGKFGASIRYRIFLPVVLKNH